MLRFCTGLLATPIRSCKRNKCCAGFSNTAFTDDGTFKMVTGLFTFSNAASICLFVFSFVLANAFFNASIALAVFNVANDLAASPANISLASKLVSGFTATSSPNKPSR